MRQNFYVRLRGLAILGREDRKAHKKSVTRGKRIISFITITNQPPNPTSSCLRAEENLSPGSTSCYSSTTPRSSSSEQVPLFPLSHTLTLNNPHLHFRETPTTLSEKYAGCTFACKSEEHSTTLEPVSSTNNKNEMGAHGSQALFQHSTAHGKLHSLAVSRFQESEESTP